ncbi:MAG: HPr family phosphocarrier protein [Spirochaetaceae bacterium]|jgi:phosphotransferase system HPr (HPr) family protein|nr:HPr family phosphocarrier protein [Spirochaetaceae bacterium]
MVSGEFVITNPTGLHTRPGNDFVKTAKQFSCSVTVSRGERSADGKSLLKLMKVNVVQGDVMVIQCDGPDEEAALESLGNYLASLKE